jgi:hypothetical protein
MALADIIRGNLQQLQQQTAPVNNDEAQRAARLLRASRGKAVGGGTTPTRSNITEQQQQVSDQYRPQLEIQSAGIEQEQEQLGQQQDINKQQQKQSRAELMSKLSSQENSILEDLERSRTELGSARGRAKLEQAGFVMRLQNREYLDRLEAVGIKKRLDNDLKFKQELQRSIFKDAERALGRQYKFQELMDADDREFATEMSRMDIDSAMAILRDDMAARSKRQIAEGAGQMVSAGANYLGNNPDMFSNSPDIPNRLPPGDADVSQSGIYSNRSRAT